MYCSPPFSKMVYIPSFSAANAVRHDIVCSLTLCYTYKCQLTLVLYYYCCGRTHMVTNANAPATAEGRHSALLDKGQEGQGRRLGGAVERAKGI
jgi:hypothetical protein